MGNMKSSLCEDDVVSEIRLQPIASKPTWSHPYLSVSSNSRRIVVTSVDHTLDIYSWDGK